MSENRMAIMKQRLLTALLATFAVAIVWHFSKMRLAPAPTPLDLSAEKSVPVSPPLEPVKPATSVSIPAQRPSTSPSELQALAVARILDDQFETLASRFWEPGDFSSDDIASAEALGLFGDPHLRFNYLPEDVRQQVMDLRVWLAQRKKELSKDGHMTLGNRDLWCEAVSQYSGALDVLLGDSRPQYDLRESDEAHKVRRLQAEGLAFTAEQFAATVGIEIQANRALNEPDADSEAVALWKTAALQGDPRLGPAAAQRLEMLEDPLWEALSPLFLSAAVSSQDVETLWRLNKEYGNGICLIDKALHVTSEQREANVIALRQALLAKAAAIISPDVLSRIVASPGDQIPFLIHAQQQGL